MWPRFTITYLLRSTFFFALASWAITWPVNYPHMTTGAVFLVPAAIGGGIGALFGKTPHGVFFGFVFEAVVVALLTIAVAIALIFG